MLIRMSRKTRNEDGGLEPLSSQRKSRKDRLLTRKSGERSKHEVPKISIPKINVSNVDSSNFKQAPKTERFKGMNDNLLEELPENMREYVVKELYPNLK